MERYAHHKRPFFGCCPLFYGELCIAAAHLCRDERRRACGAPSAARSDRERHRQQSGDIERLAAAAHDTRARYCDSRQQNTCRAAPDQKERCCALSTEGEYKGKAKFDRASGCKSDTKRSVACAALASHAPDLLYFTR